MVKTLKYRLFPTKNQQRLLQAQLNECRWLYNHLLEERKTLYETEQKSIGYYDQTVKLPELKKQRESLKTVHSQVLQNVAVRVDLAYKAFFRRVKAGGEEPGYPRFKGYDRYDSFTYPQYSKSRQVENNRLDLPKIGFVKIKLYRPLTGMPKTCIIRRTGNKWFACISVEYEPKPLRKNTKAVGIDVGLENFATLSTKETIANPRFFRAEEKALAKAQRKLSKQKKDSPERRKAKKVVVRVHERIKNRRHNFIHQESRKIVNRFGVICVEKLNTKSMLKNHWLAKSISDVAWNQFAQALAFKAEETGRQFVAIDPRGTSQKCSQCGTVVKKKLSTRWHNCPVCDIRLHRDYNASLNILALGLQSLPPLADRSPRL